MSLFEVRGSEVYPTWDNDRYESDMLPVFEIRGNDVFPTSYNDHYDSTWSAAFEIRDGFAYPTFINDDDDGFEVPDTDASGMSFGETTVALGLAAFLQGRANARERAASRRPRAPSLPPRRAGISLTTVTAAGTVRRGTPYRRNLDGTPLPRQHS